jgi:ribonuclease HI
MVSNGNFTETDLYTDGSCHTQSRIGGWASILWINSEKIILKGVVAESTNNRMELTAVIEALLYLKTNYSTIQTVRIYSDSQYVIGIPRRKEKLIASGLLTKKGKPIPNSDLVLKLLEQLNFFTVVWIKVKAHQKSSGLDNYNIEVDKLSRRIVREAGK